VLRARKSANLLIRHGFCDRNDVDRPVFWPDNASMIMGQTTRTLPAHKCSYGEEGVMSMLRPRTSLGGLVIALAAVGLLTAHMAAQTSAPAQSQPTFSKDVAPILQKHCQECHRPGMMAPMSLLTYQDARPWARSIKTKVSNREMPPWFIDKHVGIQKYKNDPSLSDAEIQTIVKWVDQGALQGNAADMPPARNFGDLEAWHIQPTVIVKM